MEVLDRFGSSGNLESWLFRAERYFTYLGFAEKDWLPLPSFYLAGDALNWFNWYFRNNQFFDWKHFKAKFAQHFRQQPTTDPSHFSSVFESADETGNLKEDHVLDKLPERYENIDSLALITGSNTNIQYLEDIEAPQVRHVKLVEVADMVQDTSAIIEAQVFGKISHTAMSSDINDRNVIVHEGSHFATTLAKLNDDSFCENCSLKTKVPNAVLNDTNYSNTEEEENSQDTPAARVFDKAPQRYISGFMVPFSSQGIVVSNASMRFAAIDFSLDGTLWFHTVPCLSTSLEESCGANQNMVSLYLDFSLHTCNWFASGQRDPPEAVSLLLVAKRNKDCHLYSEHIKDARDTGIPISSYMAKWFDTGQEFNITSGCASLPPVPLSSVSGSHTLFEATAKRWGCLFAKLYDREQLCGIEFGVEAFNAIYLNECFRVLENIEVRHIDNFLMEYEHDLPVKVLHSDDDKVRISKFLVSAKCMHDILEQKLGNQLMDARRQHNMTILSSPAYFVRNILAKTLVSLPPNNNYAGSMNLQPYSCSLASFIIYFTFLTLPFDPGIHDIPLPYGANVTVFADSSFPSIYVLIVTLWGAQVCGLGLKHVRTDEYEHFSGSLEVPFSI
ncbi:hypothetical protein A4A49_23939 [Nicotiana attenuata]|uniref:Retrotransposon gag domain-containing protein n=1 Tax=Nicotiana attenuata TaxID=49451 RepID=A0A1J6L8M8_NICAT|nr:hypothetical protein A4A49_23939 [Nicotiana attenuata]